MAGEYIILDLETTYNSKTKREEIIEIFAIKIDEAFNKISEFYKTINPKIPLTFITKKVTGITDESLKDSPPIREVITEIYDFLGEHSIIAHNASFDSKVLKEHFKRHDLDLNNIFIDSLRISKELTHLRQNSLSELKSYFNINLSSHRAKEDVFSLLEILRKLDIIHRNKKGKSFFENFYDYRIHS